MITHILGDSITRGYYGVNYSRYLDSSFQVKGWDGATLLQILDFGTPYYKKLVKGDNLILFGGANDLIYRYLSLSQNGWNNYILQRMNVNLPISIWKKKVTQKIESIITSYPNNPVFMCTIALEASFGNTDLMELTHLYNEVIKSIASLFSLSILDFFKDFNAILENKNISNYIALNPESLETDALFIEGDIDKADQVSSARGLHLSIDGLHPNNKGAKCIVKTIKNTIV